MMKKMNNNNNEAFQLNYDKLSSIFESATELTHEYKLLNNTPITPQNFQQINNLLYTVMTRGQGYRCFVSFVQDQMQKFFVEQSPRPQEARDLVRSSPRASPMLSPTSSPRTPTSKTLLIAEYIFVNIFKDILFSLECRKHVQEYKLLDVFDTLDIHGKGVIRVKDMYIFLVCLVAKQGGILTKFLFQFGDYIFALFKSADSEDDKSDQIRIEHVHKLSIIAQISNYKVQKQLQKVLDSTKLVSNLEEVEYISKEDFMLMYFAIFSDTHSTQTSNARMRSRSPIVV